MKIRDVMHKEVWTVSPDMAVSELGRELARRGISGAPVVDRHGKMLGVASLADVAAAPDRAVRPTARWGHFWHMGVLDDALLDSLSREGVAGQGPVRDIMTPAVYTVAPDDSLSVAADQLLSYHIHRLLVVEDDRPVGIVTSTDLIRVLRDMLKVTA